MRVVLIGDYPMNTEQLRGGVQSASAYLVRGLSRLENLEMHVLTIRNPGWTGSDCIEQNRVTTHLLSPHPRFERLRNYRIYQSIVDQALMQIQPDLIHSQDATIHSYVALRSGYPTVVTAHGIRCEDGRYYGSWGRRLRNYFDSWVIERYIMSNTRYLIAISRYVTDYFNALLRSDIQIFYIPNPINERFFGLPLTSNEGVVLFAGGVIPRKRVIDLVQAFAQVVQISPSSQLRIAGECSSEPAYVESIRRFIHRANLGEHVHMLGPLTESMILDEFAKCTFLVLPSYQETTPMVLGQAMAAGKPVIATRVGGIPEMVGEAGERGLLVNRGDIDRLAEAILQMLRDSSLRKRMGEAGYAFARENYHLDRVTQRTEEVYQQIVAAEQRTNV